MPNPYAVGSIAGVALEKDGEDLRCVVLDGANLQMASAINNRISASGNVYTQSIGISAGRRFGVRLDFCPVDVLEDIIAAIKAALDAQDTFNVTLEDDLHSIDVDAVPDPNWLQYAEQRLTGDQVKGAVLRFLTA